MFGSGLSANETAKSGQNFLGTRAVNARGIKNGLKSISTGISGIISNSVKVMKNMTEHRTAITINLDVFALSILQYPHELNFCLFL
jgi:hypothetical protein